MNSTREFPDPTRNLIYYEHLKDGTIVVFDGKDYRRQDDGPSGPVLKSFDDAEFQVMNRLRFHRCEVGNYPWDHWREWAIQDGIPEDLAQLGRSLIREADQHSWPDELQRECGWSDSGAAMLELARRHPKVARTRWEYLLNTDGERGDV